MFAGFPLVHSLLLPEVTGAEIPDWWWRHHCRMWTYSHLLSGRQVVGREEEQEARCSTGAHRRRQPLALRYVDARTGSS